MRDLHMDNLEHPQPLIDFCDRSLSHHSTGFDDPNAGTELGELMQNMTGNHDRFAHFLQGFQQFPHFNPRAWIQPRSGFIQQQDSRIMQQHACER